MFGQQLKEDETYKCQYCSAKINVHPFYPLSNCAHGALVLLMISCGSCRLAYLLVLALVGVGQF